MGTVDVGIGHDDNAVIAQLREVGLLGIFVGANGNAQGTENVYHRVALKHLVVHCLLHVKNLSAQGQDGLEVSVTALLCRATCRVSLHEEQLTLGRVAAGAVGELAGQSATCQRRLALNAGSSCLGGMTGSGGKDNLLDNGLGLVGMLLKINVEGLAQTRLHSANHLGVAEFCLGLSLKLRLKDLNRDNGGESLTEVLGLNVNFHLVEHLAVLGIFLERRAQTAAETGEVGTTLNGVDVVDKGIDVLVKRGVIGHGNFHGDVALVGANVDNIVDERLLAGVDVAHKLIKTCAAKKLLAAGISLLVFLTQVGEGELYTGVQVGQVAQASGKDAILVDGGLGKDSGIGVELNGGAVLVAALAYHLNLAGGLAIGIFLAINLAATANLGTQVIAKRVNARNSHAVQATRHFVRTFIKFSTGMKHCHHHLKGRLVKFFMFVNGDSATVVANGYRIILANYHVNGVAKTGKSLVDGVVNHLTNKVVQSLNTRIANVHCRTLANCLKAFEHLNVMGRILFFFLLFSNLFVCHMIIFAFSFSRATQ